MAGLVPNLGDVRLVLDGAALRELFTAENGIVGRDLMRRGQLVLQRQRDLVVYSNDDPPDGHLRDALVKRFGVDAQGAAVYIGSDHPRTLLYNNGSKPHEIVPKQAKVLKFKIGGATVFAMKVNHPGTKPTKFLEKSLDAARG